MIEGVRILNANFSGLEEKFPDNLELNIYSDIVLLLGPNNVGKTAFLRMLATSIEFRRHWTREQVSHYLNYSANGGRTVAEVIEFLKGTPEVEEGWFFFPFFTDSHMGAVLKLCERRGISLDGHVRSIDNMPINNTPAPFPQISNCGFEVISSELRDGILGLEELLRDENEENIWGFVSPTIRGDGEIYFQHFDLPIDNSVAHEQRIGLRRYVDFDNRDLPPKGHKSPGTDLFKKLMVFLERDIVDFLERGKALEWKRRRYDDAGQLEYTSEAYKTREEKLTDVPEDARLCVMMDEPTIYLDAVNKFRFQQKLQELIGRYPGRLQFFIASNDFALIRGLEGNCTYINLYEDPAVSEVSFDVQRYLTDCLEVD